MANKEYRKGFITATFLTVAIGLSVHFGIDVYKEARGNPAQAENICRPGDKTRTASSQEISYVVLK